MWKGSDLVEQMFVLAIGREVAEFRAREREDLAIRVVNNLARAMKKRG